MIIKYIKIFILVKNLKLNLYKFVFFDYKKNLIKVIFTLNIYRYIKYKHLAIKLIKFY